MKILIVRFSSIGDIVLTFPVLEAIKQKQPNAEIHYATKKSFAELLEATPFIDRVHLLSDSFSDFKQNIVKEKFDAVIDLHNNLRSKRLTFGMKGKVVRFEKLNWRKWILTSFQWNLLPNIHIVDRYLATLKALNLDFPVQLRNQFLIPEGSHVDLSKHYPALGQNFVAIAIGAQFKTKQVPKEKWVEILQNIDKPVVIVGGKMDTEMAEFIVNALPQKTILNACGTWRILESASIVSQAKSVLSNDTGMMHIAACFNVQIISIWGNTVPEFGMSPYRPNGAKDDRIFQVDGLACRPCSKIGFESCPKKHFHCMQQQNANEIAASVMD